MRMSRMMEMTDMRFGKLSKVNYFFPTNTAMLVCGQKEKIRR